MAGETIVVIDDEPNIVEMFSMFLQIKGYVPRGAMTGEDGLTLVTLEKPQAVLLDLMLPDIQGDEVLRRLRADPVHKSLPVLIISAIGDDRARATLLELGANGFLSKPVGFPQLIAELQRVLETRETTTGGTTTVGGTTAGETTVGETATGGTATVETTVGEATTGGTATVETTVGEATTGGTATGS